MHLKVNHITHVLCFVLGCSFTLLIMSYNLREQDLSIVFNKEQFKLIVLILSAPGNSDQRTAIRQTWASDFDDSSQYVFAIGKNNIDASTHIALNEEQSANGDILLLPVHESYGSLTKKLLAGIMHLTNLYTFQYLLKVDDDSFVNVKKLMKALDFVDPSTPIYWGYFNGKATVLKKGKWKEDEWFLCDRYLPYALGGGYILSFPAVQYIVNNAHLLSVYNSEDVSVGTWLAPLNMSRLHDTRFDTGHISRGCQNSHIISHKKNPALMTALHTSLIQSGHPCIVETEISKPYQYDWSLPPSKCCSKLFLTN